MSSRIDIPGESGLSILFLRFLAIASVDLSDIIYAFQSSF